MAYARTHSAGAVDDTDGKWHGVVFFSMNTGKSHCILILWEGRARSTKEKALEDAGKEAEKRNNTGAKIHGCLVEAEKEGRVVNYY